MLSFVKVHALFDLFVNVLEEEQWMDKQPFNFISIIRNFIGKVLLLLDLQFHLLSSAICDDLVFPECDLWHGQLTKQ